MALDPNVQAALVAAGTALGVTAMAQVWSYWTQRREQRLQTQIQYLYPLKIACDDLLDRWNKIYETANKEQKGYLRESYYYAKEAIHTPEFYWECNDFRCGPVGTMYATACYFAYSRKLREQLPLVRIRQKDALALLAKTNAVRTELGTGDPGAFWTEIQDSIGQLVMTDTGQVVPYKAFCLSLIQDTNSYNRLINFYVDIEEKLDFQLHKGRVALSSLQKELSRILKTPAIASTIAT
jgi:hypothetical protein